MMMFYHLFINLLLAIGADVLKDICKMYEKYANGLHINTAINYLGRQVLLQLKDK